MSKLSLLYNKSFFFFLNHSLSAASSPHIDIYFGLLFWKVILVNHSEYYILPCYIPGNKGPDPRAVEFYLKNL